MAAHPQASFAELLEAEPRLRRKDLLSDFYGDALLTSDAARETWAEPDRAPLPAG